MPSPASTIGQQIADRRLEIRLLGPIGVRVDGEVVPLGGARPAVLPALIATRAGREIPADRLSDYLRAGDPPDSAATTLKSDLSRLRRPGSRATG